MESGHYLTSQCIPAMMGLCGQIILSDIIAISNATYAGKVSANDKKESFGLGLGISLNGHPRRNNCFKVNARQDLSQAPHSMVSELNIYLHVKTKLV